MNKHKIDIILAVVAITLFTGIIMVLQQRNSGAVPTTVDHQVIASKSSLPEQFVWNVTICSSLTTQPLIMKLAGSESQISCVISNNKVQILQLTKDMQTRILVEVKLSGEIKANSSLQLSKTATTLALFLNQERIIFAPLPLEVWHESSWSCTGTTPVTSKCRLQKVSPLNFSDDFMHGSSAGLAPWQADSGEWKVLAEDNPARSANPYSLLGKGQNARISTGYSFWRNYEMQCSIQPLDNREVGVIFNQSKLGSYYHLKWVNDKEIRLLKISNGSVETILGKYSLRLIAEQWYRLKVSHLHGQFKVWLDGHLIIQAIDVKPLYGGKIALWTNSSKGAIFDDISANSATQVEFNLAKQQLEMSKQTMTIENSNKILFATSTDKETNISIPGIFKKNSQVTIKLAELKRSMILYCRRNQHDFMIKAKLKREDDRLKITLFEQRPGFTNLLQERTIPFPTKDEELTLHVLDANSWVTLGRKIICYASLDEVLTAGGSGVIIDESAAGVVCTKLSAGSEVKMPSLNNRVHTFEHEKSMANWSDPGKEWSYGHAGKERAYWHNSDYWQDFKVSADLHTIAELPNKTNWKLIIKGLDDEQHLQHLTIGFSHQDNSYQLTLNDTTNFSKRKLLAVPQKSISVSRKYGCLLIHFDGKIVLNIPLPNYLHSLCRIAYQASGPTSLWGRALNVSADGIKTYSFKKAPIDWQPVSGTWEITNRWQCDPRWSFFSGHNLKGVACNWNKIIHGDNVTIEVFVGPKMDRDRGKHYEYAADLNAVICADGKDINSGYSFMYGGWNNRGSQIVREDKVVKENRSIKILRDKKIHHQWFFLKIRKYGNRLSFWLDNVKVADYIDDKPLLGNRFAVWTNKNALMVGQVRISTDKSLDRTSKSAEYNYVPKTPYHK